LSEALRLLTVAARRLLPTRCSTVAAPPTCCIRPASIRTVAGQDEAHIANLSEAREVSGIRAPQAVLEPVLRKPRYPATLGQFRLRQLHACPLGAKPSGNVSATLVRRQRLAGVLDVVLRVFLNHSQPLGTFSSRARRVISDCHGHHAAKPRCRRMCGHARDRVQADAHVEQSARARIESVHLGSGHVVSYSPFRS
jgi:hypothetical protein